MVNNCIGIRTIAYAAFITYTRDFPASVSNAMICDLVKRDFS
ncbi:hypothetical protein [Pseudoalteromonas sp. CO342X]|nr:hypothetical protein [Pseudoalteromonas sp. CO342X]